MGFPIAGGNVALLKPTDWTLNLPRGRNAPWTDLCNSTFLSCRAERKHAHDYVCLTKICQGFFSNVLRVCNSMVFSKAGQM